MRLLLSYFYYSKVDLDDLVSRFPEKPDIFADSGAFSALTKNETVSLHDYVAWLKRWSHLITAYPTLDVIYNPKATHKNQLAMEAMGLHPIPVFHGGSDFSILEKYCQDYDYICLGGLISGSGAGKTLFPWIIKAFKIARANGVYFHGFGQTNSGIMANFPWYSVDSSTWGSAHRYGRLCLWDEKARRLRQFTTGNHTSAYKFANLIRLHGGDPAELGAKGFALTMPGKAQPMYHRQQVLVMTMSIRGWQLFEDHLQRRHGPVGPPKRGGPAGPLIYLVAMGGGKTELIEAANLVGPKIYLAEGSYFNIQRMAEAQGGAPAIYAKRGK